MANEEKLFSICEACNGAGTVKVPDGMLGGTIPEECPGCSGAGYVEWGKLSGLLEVIKKCADILDKCIDIKEKCVEIKEVVDAL